MRHFLTYAFLFVYGTFWGQEKYPKNIFEPPLHIPLILSGTFGELRPNHFHAGIDIKTQQRQGLPVYAIADGIVSRIKVSLRGYGKALYVAHPNGYTSVYAHLQKFGSEIQKYIKNEQYSKRRYEVEVWPEHGKLEVKKGDIIAYTGNTGGSHGPHLHFEIRNSVTEKPINPLHYGFKVDDATPPIVVSLFGYPLSENAHLNQSEEKIQLNFTKQADHTYKADPVTALGTVGFGFSAFDRQDLAINKNGPYRITQTVNGKVYTDYCFETFSFAESHYINTLIDYEWYKKTNQFVQKTFKEPHNRLEVYKTLYADGKINVKAGLNYQVEVLIKDFEGNETKVIIPIIGKSERIKRQKQVDTTLTWLEADVPNTYHLGAAKVYFPKHTFYHGFYMDMEKGKDTIRIHNNTVPTHRSFTITFDVSKYTTDEKKQLFVAQLSDDGKPRYTKTYKRGDIFTAKTRNLGVYTLMADTIPPKISARNFRSKKWLNNYNYLKLTISDDLSGIQSYNAYINGEWILLEYEPKNQTVTYNFEDKKLKQMKCHLKVIVTDNVGNTEIFEDTFYRE